MISPNGPLLKLLSWLGLFTEGQLKELIDIAHENRRVDIKRAYKQGRAEGGRPDRPLNNERK